VLLAGVFVDKKPIPVAEFVEKLLFLTTTDGIDYTDLGDALKRALLSRPTKTTLPKMCPPRCLWAKKKKKTMTTTTGNNDNDADVNKHLVESLFFCFFATCLAEQNSPVSLLRHVLEYLVEVHNTVSATYKVLSTNCEY
jgi:hypothetical protein